MKKHLLALPLEQLAEIAKSFSIYGTKEELASRLAAYFKDYRISWQDVKHRFQLKDEA